MCVRLDRLANGVLFACGLLLSVVWLSGCGGGDSVSEPADGSETDRSTQSSTTSGLSTSSDKPDGSKTANGKSGGSGRTSHNLQQQIGDIPYNVWFQDPLKVAANTKPTNVVPLAGGPVEGPPGTTNGDAGSGANSTPGTAGSDWKSIIPLAILDAETKRIRNHLTQSMQTVGRYNGNYKDIQIDGATLAALGAIAIEHPEPVKWKKNAHFVRDLGVRIEEGSQGLGKKAFEATQLPYEQLIDILNGNKPAGLPESAPKVPFDEVADRGGLMKRMQKAYNWMKQNVTTESLFKEKAEMVTQEATVMAALSRVIALEGYDAADEPEYQKSATAMLKAALEIRSEVGTDNFEGFTNALNVINKSCIECHTEYRD